MNPVFMVGLGLPEFLHSACPAYGALLETCFHLFSLLRQALHQRSWFPVLRKGNSTCEVYGPEPTSSGDLPALHKGVALWAGEAALARLGVWRSLGFLFCPQGDEQRLCELIVRPSWPAAPRMPRARRPLWRSTSRAGA